MQKYTLQTTNDLNPNHDGGGNGGGGGKYDLFILIRYEKKLPKKNLFF